MKRMTRLTYLLLASTILSGYVCANPDCLDSLGLGIPAAEAGSADAMQEKDFVRCQEILRDRGNAKVLVVRDLLDGRLTLIQAAVWFKELNDQPAEFPSALHLRPTAVAEAELTCLQVIQWANVEMASYSRSQRDAVLHRLREEMRVNMLQNKGEVVLPRI